jgi:hypothetical protein
MYFVTYGGQYTQIYEHTMKEKFNIYYLNHHLVHKNGLTCTHLTILLQYMIFYLIYILSNVLPSNVHRWYQNICPCWSFRPAEIEFQFQNGYGKKISAGREEGVLLLDFSIFTTQSTSLHVCFLDKLNRIRDHNFNNQDPVHRHFMIIYM